MPEWIQQVVSIEHPLIQSVLFLFPPLHPLSCFYSLPGSAEFFPFAHYTCMASAQHRAQVELLPANKLKPQLAKQDKLARRAPYKKKDKLLQPQILLLLKMSCNPWFQSHSHTVMFLPRILCSSSGLFFGQNLLVSDTRVFSQSVSFTLFFFFLFSPPSHWEIGQ